jgi:uncharacterized membrane protein YhaH (DUF805 family)
MGFGAAIGACFSNYATFGGRAPRSEYWWFILFYMIVEIVAQIIDRIIGAPILSLLAGLGLLLPNISVAVRRLHDTDRSGWWCFIPLVPVVGAILLIVWYCTPGTPGTNRFGTNPLAVRLR